MARFIETFFRGKYPQSGRTESPVVGDRGLFKFFLNVDTCGTVYGSHYTCSVLVRIIAFGNTGDKIRRDV